MINSCNGLISSFLYTSGDTPEREYLLSSGASADPGSVKLIKESLKKIGFGLNGEEMESESSIVSLFKYIDEMCWAEILSDPYNSISTLYLYNGKDPSQSVKVSEINTGSRYQSHYEILANHMDLLKEKISEMK